MTENSSSDEASQFNGILLLFQLQVAINSTQTGLTKSMNLLAHTKKTLGWLWLQAQLAPGVQTMSFSLSLSSAFFCVGFILRQIRPSWCK